VNKILRKQFHDQTVYWFQMSSRMYTCTVRKTLIKSSVVYQGDTETFTLVSM
jgi:hypothetical protein